MKLAIVIGHSKIAQGAMSTDPLNMSEYEFNTVIAENMFRYGKDKGLDVKVFTRDEIGIVGAYRLVNKWVGEDRGVCIELHFNAANTKAQGTEVLYDTVPSSNEEFSQVVHDDLCVLFKRIGKTNRGIKLVDVGRGARNLAECKVIGCLVEPFFGDNVSDAKLAKDNMTAYPVCLVNSVLKYLTP